MAVYTTHRISKALSHSFRFINICSLLRFFSNLETIKMPKSKGFFARAGDENLQELNLNNMNEGHIVALGYQPGVTGLTEQLHHFLMKHNLLRQAPQCPTHLVKCVIRKRNDIGDGIVFRCPNYKRDKCEMSNVSVRKWSIFENSKLHIGDFIMIALKYLRCNRLTEIENSVNLAHVTVIHTVDVLREVLTQWTQASFIFHFKPIILTVNFRYITLISIENLSFKLTSHCLEESENTTVATISMAFKYGSSA